MQWGLEKLTFGFFFAQDFSNFSNSREAIFDYLDRDYVRTTLRQKEDCDSLQLADFFELKTSLFPFPNFRD